MNAGSFGAQRAPAHDAATVPGAEAPAARPPRAEPYPSPNVSGSAALFADPARAAMLAALMDGSARPAGELAWVAGVTPQSASGHLARLVEGGLLSAASAGRHRYFRLAGPQVAAALEALAGVLPVAAVRARPLSRNTAALRDCRRCYDHLAGRVAVAFADLMRERGYLAGEDTLAVTDSGRRWLAETLGIDVALLLPARRRPLVRGCLDWTERRPHLAGALGARLFARLGELGWIVPGPIARHMQVTDLGRRELARIGVALD